MSLIIATKIQNTVPDSIEYADDIALAVRANGEQRTSFIDLAGNVYNAEIPAAINAPTLVGFTAAADGVTPVGFYGYKYVFAAETRYPLVDGGNAKGGSIAPRGNPSPSLVVHLVADSNYINLSLLVCDRKDISHIWVFRSVNYSTAADAQLATDAGLCFYVGKVANAPGTGTVAFEDKLPSPGLDQIEFDNFAAPTFKYVRYIPPYFWGIGNDPLTIPVQWNGQIVTITDGSQWFDGRNGQQASINAVTTGGIDGFGTFIFRAGDTAGFNQQQNCILTKDGITPETLSPATGTGYITIQGDGTVLFRSKPRNPFAWGETQTIGAAKLAQIYALSIARGNASAIIGLPEDQGLKIDFKNPSSCYILNLRLAGTPEFASSLRLISSYSISAHSSQFVASVKSNSTVETVQKVRKVLWGWDSDTFAILQSDGTDQVPISDPIFQTLRLAVKDPYRIRFAHGLCDDENELNCLWIPFVGADNFASGYPGGLLYKQTPLTDLMIYQHIPSGTWGFVNHQDLTSANLVRDLNLNKIRIVGGTEQGLITTLNDINQIVYIRGFVLIQPIAINYGSFPTSIDFPAGTFSGFDPATFVGVFASLYAFDSPTQIYYRISSLVGDTLFIDLILLGDFNTGIYNYDPGFAISDIANCKFAIGAICTTATKTLDFGNQTEIKRIEELYYKGGGVGMDNLLTFMFSNGNDRLPASFQDTTPFSDSIFSVGNVALPQNQLVTIQSSDFSGSGLNLKGIGIKLNN